jgi:hypothetical protein
MKVFLLLIASNIVIYLLGVYSGWCGKAMWDHHVEDVKRMKEDEEKGEKENETRRSV